MLKTATFQTATGAAAAVASLGKVITTNPGTPLSELVRLSSPIFTLGADGKIANTTAQNPDPTNVMDDNQFFGFMAEAATTGTIDNPSQHSLELDGLIKDLSTVVGAHVSHARNVVRPLVQELAVAFTKHLTEAKPDEAADNATITTLRLPALLRDVSFLDTLSAFKDKAILTPDQAFGLPAISKEELDGLLTIGHDRSDKLIVEWLSHLPEGFAFNVWNTFFMVQGRAGFELQVDAIARLNPFSKADVALAILLISRKLEANVMTVDSMNLNTYNKVCAQYVEYASTLLINTLTRVEALTRGKVLVVDKDPLKMQIAVNGELYGAWLEAGGTPEVILGVMITEGSPVSMLLIDEKKDEYLAQWNSYSVFYRARSVNNSFGRALSQLEVLFVTGLQEMGEEERAVLSTPALIEAVVAEANAYIRTQIKPDDLKDPYMIALMLIAKIRFKYTSAYQILNDIVEASKVNAGVDVREAALLAVINYISDYFAGQISIQ
jgi:hypothetical protein